MDKMNEITKMYRVDQRHEEGASNIKFYEFAVIRQTEKSAWINKSPCGSKIIRVTKELGAKMPYAFPSKEAALTSYIHRKRRHIGILKHMLGVAIETRQVCQLMIKNKDYTDKLISHYELDHHENTAM